MCKLYLPLIRPASTLHWQSAGYCEDPFVPSTGFAYEVCEVTLHSHG